MKFRYSYNYSESSSYNIKQSISHELEKSWCSGQIEDIETKQNSIINAFSKLVQMLYENDQLTKEQVKEFIPKDYEEVVEDNAGL